MRLSKWFKDIGVTLQELHRCDTPSWKSGMAYATVSSDDDLQKGLKRHKQNLEGRYINVLIKNKKEMKGVLDCAAILDSVVRLRGIPYKCKDKDITGFFKGLSICPNGIYIISKEGQAYVRFEDVDTAKKALEKNDSYMGDRYVKVFMCKLAQLTELKYSIFKNDKKGMETVNKFFSTDKQPSAKKSPQKAVSKVSEDAEEDDDDDLSEDSDDEMLDEEVEDEDDEEEEAEDEEDDEEEEDEEDEFMSADDDEISMGDESDEEETTPKESAAKKKQDLSSKGFTAKKDNPAFTEFVKSGPEAKKSGGKRTSTVKTKDSDDEVAPQLVAITPKPKGTPSAVPKRLSTAKKGKRRSMFTETPK